MMMNAEINTRKNKWHEGLADADDVDPVARDVTKRLRIQSGGPTDQRQHHQRRRPGPAIEVTAARRSMAQFEDKIERASAEMAHYDHLVAKKQALDARQERLQSIEGRLRILQRSMRSAMVEITQEGSLLDTVNSVIRAVSGTEPLVDVPSRFRAASAILDLTDLSPPQKSSLAHAIANRNDPLFPARHVAAVVASFCNARPEIEFTSLQAYMQSPMFAAKVQLIDQLIKLRDESRTHSHPLSMQEVHTIVASMAESPALNPTAGVLHSPVHLHRSDIQVPFRLLKQDTNPADQRHFESAALQTIAMSAGRTRQLLSLSMFLTAASSGSPSLLSKLLSLSDKGLLRVNLRGKAVTYAALRVALSSHIAGSDELRRTTNLLVPNADEDGLERALLLTAEAEDDGVHLYGGADAME